MGTPIEELEFCLSLWEEKGFCRFGGKTNCIECGTPYILLKLVNGEALHGKEMKRLSLQDWKNKVKELKK